MSYTKLSLENVRNVNYICDANLGDMQLISKYNKRFRFLLGVIKMYRKNIRVVSWK